MSILPALQTLLQDHLFSRIQRKWHPMLLLGINALSLFSFSSLNSNARSCKGRTSAAVQHMYRLVRHQGLLTTLSAILVSLIPITDKSFICIDFTIFHPFAVLCFAVQTKKGRALPVWIDVIKYPIPEDSQNIFILTSLRRFIAYVQCHPTLVCDRGFIGRTLIRGFDATGCLFYVRMKAGKSYIHKGKQHLLRYMRPL